MRKAWLGVLASCLMTTSAGAAVIGFNDVLVGSETALRTGFVRSGSDLSRVTDQWGMGNLGAWLPNGYAVFGNANNVGVLDTTTGIDNWTLKALAYVSGTVTSLAVDDKTGNIAVGTAGGGLYAYDSNLTQLGFMGDGSYARIDSLAFDSAGNIVFAADGDLVGGVNDLVVRTVGMGLVGYTLGAANSTITSLDVRTTDDFVATGEANGDLILWDSAVSGVVQAIQLDASYAPLTDLLFDSSGDVVFGADGDLNGGVNDVVIRSGVDLSFFGNWLANLGAQVSALGLQYHGEIIIGATNNLYIYDGTLSTQLAFDSGYGVINTVDPAPAPEPSSVALLALGGLGLLAVSFRARRKRRPS